MDKIYSRKRLLIPKIKKIKHKRANIYNIKNSNRLKNDKISNLTNNNKNLNIGMTKKTIKTCIIVILAVCIANRIITNIQPTIDTLSINMAKSIATKVSNEQATAVMANYKYEDFSTIIRDDKDNIKMIKMNIITINEITSDVAVKIQDKLNECEKDEFYIRLGSFTGSKILSFRGPKIPIKICPLGNVETDLISEFNEAGINQTLHRIYLNVSCKVTILTPYNTIEENITNQVLLAEAVIIGNIPETYYNLKGLEKGDELEVIE